MVSKKLIVIEGPTASGKTGVSIALAKKLKTVILSSDSRQFYKEVSIGTAKPDEKEQSGIKHYFIDSHSINDEVSAFRFEREALEVLEDEFKQHEYIILTGGSGMFTDALCYGLDDIPSSIEMRNKLQKELDDDGLFPLLEELKVKDPDYYSIVDKVNPMRIMRAIEVIRLTGKTFTELRVRNPKKRPFEILRFVLNHDRKVLYDRINLRVDQMMENGLLAEVEESLKYRSLTSMNTVGYKELFNHLEGNSSLNEATESIKQNTRRYAKRQLTWFRRHPNSIWIDYTNQQSVVDSIFKHLEGVSI